MKKKAISIIEPVGGHGGMNYYDYGLALGLANSGFETFLFTSDSTTPIPYDNVHTYFTFSSIWKQKYKIFKVYKYFIGLINSILITYKNGIKVTHLHAFHINLLFLLSILIIRIFGLKAVITIHDVNSFSGNNLPNWISKIIFSLASEIIVHNIYSKNELLKQHPHLNVSIVEHGNYVPFVKKVDPQKFSEKFNILFFGQIKEVKGLDILLDALNILKQDKIKFHLTIVGKVWKDDFSKYQEKIIKYNLSSDLTIKLEYIPDEIAWNYFNNANLVVLPYKQIYQSGVLLMAMSYGRAVLTSNLPAFNDIVSNAHNGFVFESLNASSLAKTITEILNQKDSLLLIEKNAYKEVINKYDWNLVGKKTAFLYNKILN